MLPAAVPKTPDPDPDVAPALQAVHDGWNTSMGLRLVSATAEQVVAELDVGAQHRQPYGIVHGGVHAGIIETATSIGAALFAMKRGQSVVGLENHTSFIRAVREGTLRVTARPLTRGKRTQVWEASVTDATGRVAAKGTVRLLCIEPDAAVAGEILGVK